MVAIQESVITEETIVENIDFNKLEKIKSTTKEISDNTTEVIEADSTGKVTVKVEKTDSGYTKTYTGVKKIRVSNDKTSKTVAKNKETNTVLDAQKETSKSNESLIKINQETKTRKTNVEIKSTSTWFWILLAIVIAFYFIGRKFKFF